MPINVPQSVFDKYFDVIDSTFNIFGVTCQLISIEKREVIVYNPDDNIPDKNYWFYDRSSQGFIC